MSFPIFEQVVSGIDSPGGFCKATARGSERGVAYVEKSDTALRIKKEGI